MMTRFARAKGSKASNERAPEDGTPWEVMKEQLLKSKQLTEDAKKREEAEKQRIENYENFLKEQKVQKRKATWCDFPESNQKQNNGTSEEMPKAKKQKKSKNTALHESKSKQLQNKGTLEKASDVNLSQQQDEGNNSKSKKKNKQKIKATLLKKQSDEEDKVSLQSNVKQDKDVVVSLKNKNKNKNKQNNFKKEPTKSSHMSNNSTSQTPNSAEANEHIKNVNNNVKQDFKRKKKFENGQHTRRKAINDNSFQLIINGKEVELVRFDGFPIMKRDAERLQELKTSMMQKGIPKSEVQRTLKLERRRAEKALARLKRDVCYNCRKGGHNLSDCPDLKSIIPGVEGADGICFKCGSTEHRQSECKVQRDKEFRFACCFICKQQGHIARQCPDNPKGLYPNGGACKLCGDVTHLRKDCPTVNEQKEETSIKLKTLEGAENIEDIDQKQTKTSVESIKKPKKIKF